MTKLELNEKLAELYGIKPHIQTIVGFDVNEGNVYAYLPLIGDSARMFDLMIEHNLFLDSAWVNIGGFNKKYYTARQNGVMGATDIIFVKDHESESAAALYAIALKLVKLAESK